MPDFLRSLFKPSSPRRQSRPSRGGPLPPGVEFSPARPSRELRDSDMEAIASRLRSHLVARTEGEGDDRTMTRLLDLLEESEVTPFRESHDMQDSKAKRGAKHQSRLRKGRNGSRAGNQGGGQWKSAMKACDECLERVYRLLKAHAGSQSSNSDLLHRLVSLLEAQRAELGDMKLYVRNRGLPTLGTLKDIYTKLDSGLEKMSSLRKPKESREKLGSFVQVLSEGADYLIDIALVEAIIWYAEVIDPSYGAEIRKVLDSAIAEQGTLATFRLAAETIIALSSSLPPGAVDDKEARDASKIIGILLRQLQARVATSTTNSTGPSPAASTPTSPISPADSRFSSSASSPAEHEALGASELEKRFGTGPIPTPRHSAPPTAPPTPRRASKAESVDGPEVWEYRGNLLTRSALDLALRQERLAMADSSGQYAGEVSWDDLRNAWVPRWAEKLKPEDLADREIPSTNPADFVEKKEDAWGNKVGWRDGRMYYHEEPKFILRD